jgi:hypothetical protein
MVEEVVVDGMLRAIIVRGRFHAVGAHFFTPCDFSQQLGFFAHPAGHRILPHVHKDVHAAVRPTQEVLVIRKGRLRVDFYADGRTRQASRLLQAGDVILLASGGHGFEVLDDCEMFEVKPGPYAEGEDKIRFTPDEPSTERTDT